MEIRGDAPFGPTSQRPPAASWQAKWNVAASQRTRAAPAAETSGDLRGGNSRNVHDLDWRAKLCPRRSGRAACACAPVMRSLPLFLFLPHVARLPRDLSLAAAERSHRFSFRFFFFQNLSKDAPRSHPRLFSENNLSELLSDLHAACAADAKFR